MTIKREINSIVNAAEILKCLSDGIERLSDVSRKLNLNKATVHQILGTLKNRGLATQDPITRKYFLGPLIQRIAFNSNRVHQILIQCAHQELEKIKAISGETVGLQIQQGTQRVMLDEVMSSQQVLFCREIGQSAPIYAGAAGKVLLSELDQRDLNQLIQGLSLIPVGLKTITDKDALLREVEKIRNQGYATSINETFDGAAGIAVPVKHYACPAAIGIIGPERRFEQKMMPLLDILLKSSKTISHKLKKCLEND